MHLKGGSQPLRRLFSQWSLAFTNKPTLLPSHRAADGKGICGGSASGKTTVARNVITCLDVPWVAHLSMDAFYKILTPEQHNQAVANEYNFDHPDAFDVDLLVETLKRMKEGKQVDIPNYNYSTHARDPDSKQIYGANIVIFEGIMAFCDKRLINLMNLKIFVDTDPDIRLMRRLRRDISERGRDLDGVLKQYMRFVKPAYDSFIGTTMKYADIVVPKGGENQVAIALIVKAVDNELRQRGHMHRSKLIQRNVDEKPQPATLRVLPPSDETERLHAVLRLDETSTDDFVKSSDRLYHRLFEFTFSTDACLDLKNSTLSQLSAVSILKAGETMEQSIKRFKKSIPIGKILIISSFDTNEPELHQLVLPTGISRSRILLMDAVIRSGAAAIMAIQVLLDHDVQQDHITLVSLMSSTLGIHNVAYAFPSVKIVTTNVKHNISDIPDDFYERYTEADDEDMDFETFENATDTCRKITFDGQ